MLACPVRPMARADTFSVRNPEVAGTAQRAGVAAPTSDVGEGVDLQEMKGGDFQNLLNPDCCGTVGGNTHSL